MGLEAFGVLLSEFFPIKQTHKQKNKQNMELRRTIVRATRINGTHIYIHVYTRIHTCIHVYAMYIYVANSM